MLLASLCTSARVESAGADAAQVAREIITVAGAGQAGYAGDGGPASQARLNNPFGIARGPDGALYVCDTGNHVIRKIDARGTISTVAGTGRAGYAGDGGPATQAALNEPYELRFDAKGNLFFVEMRNHIVRRVDGQTRLITTVAGTGKAGFGGDDGPATNALMRQPHSLQFDQAGNLYICDIGNHRIRRWDPGTGLIHTFAGTGQRGVVADGASLASAPLNGPRAIDVDRKGQLWLALREGNAVYRIDVPSGTLHRAAGTGRQGFNGHGGPALEAALSGPKGISVAANGDVYLADTESHSIRRIHAASQTLERVAGTGERGDGPDGDPLQCRMARPHGVFVDANGDVYVGDSESHRVRCIRNVR